MEVRTRAPLTIATKLSQQQTKVKNDNGAVYPRTTSLRKRTPSTSSTCVLSPSSSTSTLPPPTPANLSANRQKTLTPTSSTRSRGNKYCSDPDCASPMASNASSRTSTAKFPTTPVASMSSDTYFKLLKKSQVLEHLVQMSSHVGESEQRVRRLQSEQTRTQCVQDRVFAELERYRRQVVDAQQQFLVLIENLTAICMREKQLQCNADDCNDTEEPVAVSAEEQTLRDLHSASSPGARETSTSTLETQALATVGHQRVQQLESICARYERQLVGSEAALSQAIFSDAARENAVKIAQLEARNQQHEIDKQTLQIQLALARDQTAHLQEQLDETQERRTTLEHVKYQLEQELTRHTTATQRFASDLQAELRRRYGVVPSVLELKWRQYFPRLSRLDLDSKT